MCSMPYIYHIFCEIVNNCDYNWWHRCTPNAHANLFYDATHFCSIVPHSNSITGAAPVAAVGRVAVRTVGQNTGVRSHAHF